MNDLQHLMKSCLGGGDEIPQHTEGQAAPVSRSAGTQICWEFKGLTILVSELGIKGSNFEGCLWSLEWVEGFCVVQSKVR